MNRIVPVAPDALQPSDCLAATEFLDFQHPAVQLHIQEKMGQSAARLQAEAGDDPDKKIQLAMRLYYHVRDGWLYNPYKLHLSPAENRLSYFTSIRSTYCIPKAMLLAGLARACGIPARLGFGDVKNHLSSPRLIEYLRSEIFYYHGYCELYLNNKWVQATPAFDKRLCRKMKVDPLEFDGRTNSLFQEYNQSGQAFMQYTHYHGVTADLPLDWLKQGFAKRYPHIYAETMIDGDLMQET
ncbi:MAG: transglutaminase domain-containing protein [Leptospiraceae bacterium]|nr:transglutaminase domain-containing protein [Leptospiraceae bacterium]